MREYSSKHCFFIPLHSCQVRYCYIYKYSFFKVDSICFTHSNDRNGSLMMYLNISLGPKGLHERVRPSVTTKRTNDFFGFLLSMIYYQYIFFCFSDLSITSVLWTNWPCLFLMFLSFAYLRCKNSIHKYLVV